MQRNIRAVSITEACERLKKGRATIYRWIVEDRIAAIREGGRWRVLLLFVTNGHTEEVFTLSPESVAELGGEYAHLLTRGR